MSMTISDIKIEFYWGRFAYFAGRGGEVFIKFSTGVPFWHFAKERQDDTLELWGLGMSLITNPR